MTATWLFLHGINNTHEVWHPIAAHFESDHHVVCPLLPAVADIDLIASQLWQTLNDNAVLVGHSFGGYVALAMLTQQPQRVRAIALINSHTRADNAEAKLAREQSALAAEGGKYLALVESITPRVFDADNLNDPALMAARTSQAQKYGAERFAAHQRGCAIRPDRSAQFSAFLGPKAVIASAQDRVIPTEAQRGMANQCGAEFNTVANAGHMLPAEQPAAVTRLLSDWQQEWIQQ